MMLSDETPSFPAHFTAAMRAARLRGVEEIKQKQTM